MAEREKSSDNERLLIIGWDGADWDILRDLAERGCLPYIASLMRDGATATLDSVTPNHSWAAWPSFLTGKHPAGHGVFDFIERDPGRPDARIPVTSGSIKATTFIEYLSDSGRDVRVGNVPVLFPPIPVNGRMISGVAVPPGANYVYPPEWKQQLDRRAPFPVNGLEWMHFRDRPEALLEEARRLVEERTASFLALMEGRWDASVCVYVESDRLQHAFGAYLLPSHPDYAQLSNTAVGDGLRDFYRLLDQCTERLVSAAGPNTTTVIMSDHGFRPVNRQLDLSRLLMHLGFATGARSADATKALRRSAPIRKLKGTRMGSSLKKRVKVPSALDWNRSRAYRSTTGGGVSLNLKGREPHGVVEPNSYEETRDEVRRALLEYTDPETGSHPIAEVFAREELYDGPYLDRAPDLFVKANELWSMSSSSRSPNLTSQSDWPTGRHRRAGVLLTSGPSIVPADLGGKNLIDLAPTALSFFGLKAEGLDGRAIETISGASEHDELVGPSVRAKASDDALTDQEQEQITSHLRDLGYIE